MKRYSYTILLGISLIIAGCNVDGNLDQKYTVDNSHVLGKYCADWVDWILEQARLPLN